VVVKSAFFFIVAFGGTINRGKRFARRCHPSLQDSLLPAHFTLSFLLTYPHTYQSTYLHNHPIIRTLTQANKGNGKVVPVHAMNPYTGAEV